MDTKKNMPILICPNCRGISQGIRYLLYYIEQPFIELHVNCQGKIEEQDKVNLIPEEYKLVPNQLPFLYHEGLMVT